MINLFNWVTTLVETFTFYGGGKGGGGSSSSSQAVDFFGKGDRAPYADLLGSLLLGTGGIGATAGSYVNAQGKTVKAGTKGATYVPGEEGMGIGDFITNMPGYQFQYGQGLEALNRQFAATGVGQTGAQNVALQNYGNSYAGNALQQLISNLAAPSGAGLIGNSSSSSSTGASPIPGMLGTLGAAYMMMPSDRNLKTNIKHINTINGIKIYSFNYIWSYIKSIGVMAQDLLKMPEYKHAVYATNIGYVVDYSKLPI
jgi:hypothetical protein